MSGVVLSARDLHKHYRTGEEEVRALDGLSLDITEGEFVAVMGASGSGKSTFLHLCGGLDTPTRGSVVVAGADLAKLSDTRRTLFRRQHIGVIFQQFNLLPGLSARDNVALPLLLDGVPQSAIHDRTERLLGVVHLGGRSGHRPDALSGGEQQRVAIARALINDPVLVLADEPTGNLDSQHAVEVWRLLRQLSLEQRRTMVMVTHEAEAASYADRIVVLRDGKLRGEFRGGEVGDATLVAARYRELLD